MLLLCQYYFIAQTPLWRNYKIISNLKVCNQAMFQYNGTPPAWFSTEPCFTNSLLKLSDCNILYFPASQKPMSGRILLQWNNLFVSSTLVYKIRIAFKPLFLNLERYYGVSISIFICYQKTKPPRYSWQPLLIW